jgi:predicted RNA-binding Zn ribbon-like protein
MWLYTMLNRPGAVIPAPDDDLCLTFANTCYWRGTSAPTEELSELGDLLHWTAKAERLPPDQVQQLARTADLRQGALALRETIYRCFAATASGLAPADADLAALNAALNAAPARQCVQPGGWDVGWPEPSAAALLAPVLWSAADLLAGGQLARVRQCANPDCGWLFLDNSKAGNRRWCSMSACGNRAKAHRHYLRQKDTPTAKEG